MIFLGIFAWSYYRSSNQKRRLREQMELDEARKKYYSKSRRP